MSQHSFIEGLEARTFLSVTPAPVLFDKAVLKDRAVVHAKLVKFRTDFVVGAVRLYGDYLAIKHNTAAGDTTLVSLFQTLNTEVAAARSQLLSDHLTDSATVKADEKAVTTDIALVRKDAKDATAEAAAETALTAARVQLATDLIAAVNTRVGVRSSLAQTVQTAGEAVGQAASADTLGDARFKAAAAKFSTDGSAWLGKLTADVTTINADITQLNADLAAAD